MCSPWDHTLVSTAQEMVFSEQDGKKEREYLKEKNK